MDNIERLYKCYEILSEAGDKKSEVSRHDAERNGTPPKRAGQKSVG